MDGFFGSKEREVCMFGLGVLLASAAHDIGPEGSENSNNNYMLKCSKFYYQTPFIDVHLMVLAKSWS